MSFPDVVRIRRPKNLVPRTVRVPGDKSISHRAVMFAAVAPGASRIRGALVEGDVARTVGLSRALGARVRGDEGELVVEGAFGRDEVRADCGRSGTTLRLAAGLLAGRNQAARLSADEQLLARPMARVVEPLSSMGAALVWGEDGMRLERHEGLRGGRVVPAVASAQVKGALLLAGWTAGVPVTVVEPRPTRDHTERLLRAMGARVETVDSEVMFTPGGETTGFDLSVPGDPSSAAALACAAVLCPGSALLLSDVSDNPGRRGLFDVLTRMGANVTQTTAHDDVEPRADWRVCGGEDLSCIDIGEAEVPGLIDEMMLVGLLCCRASGTSRLTGLGELRVKESDRLAEMVRVLRAFGGKIEPSGDGVVVEGPCRFQGCAVDAGRDHRVAMLAALCGLCADGVTTVTGAGYVADSFPGFFDLFAAWGAMC